MQEYQNNKKQYSNIDQIEILFRQHKRDNNSKMAARHHPNIFPISFQISSKLHPNIIQTSFNIFLHNKKNENNIEMTAGRHADIVQTSFRHYADIIQTSFIQQKQ